ncbi:SDR family oxidoreductase [Mycolicibacterium septicum]|uniref:SDR family oxidoreductase n=1 Tax=Mycolicibacterium septicum TaxID=98668 RepID=UPI001AFBBF25|nr:SDR family oxidoreductase [Mycolicibacterium septicum]QRY53479.1 SDR family oxidoreductase [Mycolicibacterium septicum]
MGTYAVTGSASGMGRAAAGRLRSDGHRVIGVDLRDADVIADLSTPQGRSEAAAAVLELADGRLDGAVMAAGVGPLPNRDAVHLILSVNYFGVVDLLHAWQPAFAARGNAKVVVVGSNSSSTMPMVPVRAVRALLRDDLGRAVKTLHRYRSVAPSLTYGASKIAVSRWVRRNAVLADWAGTGIRLNAIAPGAIRTPLLERQLASPREAKAVQSFPVPVGGFGNPDHLAEWMVFMLSDAAEFLCGSVIFVDGGSDAYFRASDWPRRVPTSRLPRYALRYLRR